VSKQDREFGLVLAAGRGRRMGNSSLKPKCLNTVRGKALIEYQVSALRAANVSTVVVITGYKRHLIEPYGDLEVFNDEWQDTNMVFSLLKASSVVGESGFLVSYGDIFYEESAFQLLLACPHEISILYSDNWKDLWKMRSDEPLADAESFQLYSDNTLKLIGTRPQSFEEIEGQYMGVLRFSISGWKIFTLLANSLPLDIRRTISMTSVLNLIISQGLAKIGAVKYSGWWGEIDTESDLRLYDPS